MIRNWLALAVLAAAAPAFAVAPDLPPLPYREGEVLVQYRPGAPAATLDTLRSRYGLVPSRSLLRGRAELLELPAITTTAAALAALRREPEVERAEPNFRREVRVVHKPSDALFGEQWGLLNTGQANYDPSSPDGVIGADMNMLAAWDPAGDGTFPRTGNPSVIVAVIDDSIDIDHPDLAANVVSPHNFVQCQNPDDPRPVNSDEFHGTMVAGCADAVGNTPPGSPGTGIGVAGVSWHSGLMPLKFSLDTATHLAALDWARDHGASIINASFGGPGLSTIEQDAIAALAAHDILYVAAAGNVFSNTDLAQLSYPANYAADNIVSVAATDRQDNITSFSQYGPLTVDVAAPGLQIVTTKAHSRWTTNPGMAGTSFASPYAAGAAALVKAYANPGGTRPDWREIKARLIESGSAVSGANAKERTGGGRIDVAKAIDNTLARSLVLTAVSFDDSVAGNNNHAMDPGETLDVVFTVRNIWQDATSITASLAVDNGITVNTAGPVAMADLAADQSEALRFNITIPSGITDHRYVKFAVTLNADGGYTTTRSYIAELGTLVLGTPVTQQFNTGVSGEPYDEFHAWHVDVPPFAGPGIQTLVLRTNTNNLDVDLLARPDTPPLYDITVGINPENQFGYFCTSGVTDDCRDPVTLISGRLDGDEAITIVNPTATTYHLVVVDFTQGTVSYDLSAELVNGDIRPDDFSFPPKIHQPLNTLVTSVATTITGIDAPSFVTVVGGEYSVAGGPFKSTEGTISNGQTLQLRTNSGASGARMQVTVGGVTATFLVNRGSSGGGGGGSSSCRPRGGDGGGGGMPPGALLVLLGATLARQRRTCA